MLALPNIVTLSRLAAIPVLLWLTYAPSRSALLAAACLFAGAAATDWLDGYLARRSGSYSLFGTLMDPLVDKALVLSVLFMFADLGLLPLWLVLLNMFREFLVTAVRHGASAGGHAVGANWMGKTKFCLQAGVIELCYLHLLLQSGGRSLPGGTVVLLAAAVLMTVASFAFLVVFAASHANALGLRRPASKAE